MNAVLGVIEESRADFVCLQEVTVDTKEFILNSELIKAKYLAEGGTYSGNAFLINYGVMILSKYPCLYYEKHFKTKMGRSLLCAEPLIPHNLIIATSHFESLGYSVAMRRM